MWLLMEVEVKCVTLLVVATIDATEASAERNLTTRPRQEKGRGSEVDADVRRY